MHQNFTIRMLPEDQRILDELQSRFNASGIELSNSALVRMAIRRVAVDPEMLFKPPAAEGRP
jgi:hypothetical protein